MNNLRGIYLRMATLVAPAGLAAQDSDAFRLEKRLVIAASLLTSLAALAWGSFYFVLGSRAPGAISLIYAALSLLLLIPVRLTGQFRFYIAYQLAMGLIIPAVHTILLGGFVPSSAVILWSLMSPIGALLFYAPRQAAWWGGAYLLEMVGLAFIQPLLRVTNPLPQAILLGVFVLNAVLISGIVLSMLGYFLAQKNAAFRLLRLEQEKSESLLLNVLPREIAAILKDGSRVIADQFDGASILFADLVGFTPLTARMAPVEMVTLLNEIFSYFDSLVEKYDLEKIRTIGDNYMVASGVPRPRPDHAHALACLALEMCAFVRELPPVQGASIRFRIGINSGPVVGGVIGRKKFVYDLWGDAVNLASRMESQGEPGRIQISQATYELIQGQFECLPRGTLDVKGKGAMATWFLEGRLETNPSVYNSSHP